MAATHEDRNAQLSPGVAIKAPCRAASTANLTMSGERTVDGVALVSGDRFFNKDQTDATARGIYTVSTGTWTREPDFDGTRDVVEGTIISVNHGTTNADTLWRVTNTGTIVFGTTSLTFERAIVNDSNSVSFLQAGAGAITRTVQSKERDVISLFDFYTDAQIADVQAGTGSIDVTAAILAAIAAANVSAGADGINRRIMGNAGTHLISGQIVIPTTVSLIGEGNRAFRLKVSATFAGLTTTGAVRIGNGLVASFGSMFENAMIELSGVAGSVGVYSSDVQDGAGCRNVLINNFLGYGIRFDGSGGAFGSVNNFVLEHCEALKSNSGGTSGIGISIENGTFPGNIFGVTAYGNPANPLTTAHQAINYPYTAAGIVCDGAGTNGLLLSTNVFGAFVAGLTGNGYTNVAQINTTGKVTLANVYRVGGTNTINDAGNTGVAKTITDLNVPFYVRGTAGGQAVLDQADFYSRLRLAGSIATTLLIDKAGAIGTGRLNLYIGDGSGGTVADDAYVVALNTVLHWLASSGGAEALRLDLNTGILSSKNKIFPGTDAAAIQSAVGLYAGTGAPNNANGNNGDVYFRSDGGALSTMYQRRAGAWVGVI